MSMIIRHKVISVLLAAVFLIGLVFHPELAAAQTQNNGIVKSNSSDGPIITYNVSGVNLGFRNEEKEDSFHEYNKGSYEPGEVVFWGTVANRHSAGDHAVKIHDDISYRAIVKYKDGEGKEYIIDDTNYITVGPSQTVDYRLSGVVPEYSGYVRVEIVAISNANTYTRATMEANIYRLPETSVIPGGKILDPQDGNRPTITYNVEGIKLGQLKEGEDIYLHHYEDSEIVADQEIRVFGAVRNNLANGTVTLKVKFNYRKSSNGDNVNIDTEYITIGPGYTYKYSLSAAIPEDTKGPNLEIVCCADRNTNVRSTVKIPLKIVEGEVDEWENWEPKYGVDLNKTWKIEFNKILDISTIKEKNIYVTDQAGQIVAMFFYQRQQDIDKNIYLIPIKDYEPNHRYTLWIKDLKAEDGSILKKNIKMEFTTTSAS